MKHGQVRRAAQQFLVCIAFMLGLLIGTARAAEHVDFDPVAFAAAQDAGKSIIVHVTASWCPVCAKQRPIIAELEKDPKFSNTVVFAVDYDSQYAVATGPLFHVQRQSTLIAYKGNAEVFRSTGEVYAPNIRIYFFEKSL